MGKNIVLCADGTGNRGGYTPDSNVYRMYNAVDVHDEDKAQMVFYDNGVGTSTNKYWRGLTGAFGFGFKQNVRDMYQFLSRNYEPGDDVFVFGFSRGAATVRAFTGLVAASGLVDGYDLTDDELQPRIDDAMDRYRSAPRGHAPAGGEAGSHGAIPIKFLGVWDTVSALGFPQSWAVRGIGVWFLSGLTKALDHISDVVFPHRYYNYRLTANVQWAYQALAIDDERNSFQPMVWDETVSPETKVEQVWFAGSHSNVGGGYGRAGLANVALDWMMRRAARHGLRFKEGARDDAYAASNVHGRLYDSRDGLAVYYRYKPRNIEVLCAGRLRGPTRIHESVLERMRYKTANYAPGNLPYAFDVVKSDPDAPPVSRTAAESPDAWARLTKPLRASVARREWLYGLFLEATLVIILAGLWFWVTPPPPHRPGVGAVAWLTGHLATALNYVTPKMFEGLVTVAVLENPLYTVGALGLFMVMWALKRRWRHQTVCAAEAAREEVLSTTASGTSGPIPDPGSASAP
jgi:uncharacterized protein (DUF2235 family)